MIKIRPDSWSVGLTCQKMWNFQWHNLYIMQWDTPVYILVYSVNTHRSALIAYFPPVEILWNPTQKGADFMTGFYFIASACAFALSIF